MEIKKLGPSQTEDFACLIKIFNEVFENGSDIPGHAHLKNLLSNHDFVVFVVKIDGKVVGGLTVYLLQQYYNKKPMAYIYDVCIMPAFQRKGLGRALIEELCGFCENNGMDSAYVQAEYEDVEAINFYRKTRFTTEMKAIHFTYTFTTN